MRDAAAPVRESHRRARPKRPWARRPGQGGPALRAAAAAGLVAALSLGACDGPTPPAPPEAPDAGASADLISWTPSGTGTTSVPVYGRCRLGAERVLWAASNGVSDDQVSFAAPVDDGTLTIRVVGASGLVLEGDVQLERALKDKSYRAATGTARWAAEGSEAQVVDGTLCFSERLASGVPVDAEFSLVLAVDGGGYASVSGGFHLGGEAVVVASGVTLQSDALDVDLR